MEEEQVLEVLAEHSTLRQTCSHLLHHEVLDNKYIAYQCQAMYISYCCNFSRIFSKSFHIFFFFYIASKQVCIIKLGCAWAKSKALDMPFVRLSPNHHIHSCAFDAEFLPWSRLVRHCVKDAERLPSISADLRRWWQPFCIFICLARRACALNIQRAL